MMTKLTMIKVATCLMAAFLIYGWIMTDLS